MKKLISAGLAAVLMASCSVAYAETVYNAAQDQWVVNGYWDYNANKPGSCVMSTEWPDGTKINLNVFPKHDLSENITLTIYSPSYDVNDYYTVHKKKNKLHKYWNKVSFDNNGRITTFEFNWQWYLENNQNTIIIRDVSDKFLNLFIHSETATFFPDSVDELLVGLSGTQALEQALVECEMVVTGQDE